MGQQGSEAARADHLPRSRAADGVGRPLTSPASPSPGNDTTNDSYFRVTFAPGSAEGLVVVGDGRILTLSTAPGSPLVKVSGRVGGRAESTRPLLVSPSRILMPLVPTRRCP